MNSLWWSSRISDRNDLAIFYLQAGPIFPATFGGFRRGAKQILKMAALVAILHFQIGMVLAIF